MIINFALLDLFFECLLNVRYEKECEKWQARGLQAKTALDERNKIIQKAFKDELHLIIERPKQGMGKWNDSNTEQLSEEAQESRNKDVRNHWENFKRKCSSLQFKQNVHHFCVGRIEFWVFKLIFGISEPGN